MLIRFLSNQIETQIIRDITVFNLVNVICKRKHRSVYFLVHRLNFTKNLISNADCAEALHPSKNIKTKKGKRHYASNGDALSSVFRRHTPPYHFVTPTNAINTAFTVSFSKNALLAVFTHPFNIKPA